jgi:trimeric autotransporter adhesin
MGISEKGPYPETQQKENNMKKFSTLVIIALSTLLQAMPSDTCNQNTWVTNGPVYAIAPAGDKVYIGGSFTQVGPYTGGGVPINNLTGAPAAAFPKINGSVNASCADENGGWFVGGIFTSVGGVARNNIAHILSNGSLDPAWNPNANYAVSALAMSGTTVYAGGDFDSIGGQGRNHIAALDATTGKVLAWNPNVSGVTNGGDAPSVFAIAVSGATVYVGGAFVTIGGQSRNSIAALDATTGNALAWNPNPQAYSTVLSLAVSGATVYAGGSIDTIGGQSRPGIAALDATTGKALAWNPNVDGGVYSLAVSGTTVYAGGNFITIGGQSRNYIAALDATTGNALAWNPNANYNVLSLAVSGTTVYAGGAFDTIGGQSRNYIAALDATTGNATAWNPNANAPVNALAVSRATVYAGGEFRSVGGQNRNNVAALDATTGIATAWNPNANARVNALAVSGITVYAGGEFSSVGGQSRRYIAALDAATGNALAWNERFGYLATGVNALAVSGTTVYAGGAFDSIGGQSCIGIAALDATIGNTLAWNPNANGYVLSLAVSGTTVYVGGIFNTIGGQSRSRIAALDATTGNVLAWSPNAQGGDCNPNPRFPPPQFDCSQVNSLALRGTTVYAAGNFNTIGGQTRGYIAALDATTGNALAWNLGANTIVNSVVVSGATVFAGGSFVAALDATTGNVLAWNPNISGGFLTTVNVLALRGPTIYAGGDFTSIGQGIGHSYFAQFDSSYNSPVVRPIQTSSGLNRVGLQIIGLNFHSGALVKFAYSLPKSEHVSLRLYNLNGQLQSELVNKHQDAGNYSLSLQRGRLTAGAYLVVFKAGDFHQEKMISLMK